MTDPKSDDTTSARPEVTIAVAPNGARKTKADHPALPMTATEIAETAVRCLEAGASMIHVHVRDRYGAHLLDADAYVEATAAIRRAVGERLVIQITSEAVGKYSPAEQMAVVRSARPEAVSLSLREFVPDAAHESGFASFLDWLRQERCAPQIILYTPEEARQLEDMQRRGLVAFEAIPVLYVLGRYAVGQRSEPADLLPFLAPDLPRFPHWMLCAFGPAETACLAAGALLGGHVRTGFENNVCTPGGLPASDNAGLVRAVAAALHACGRTTGTAAALREAWSLAAR